jgi:putative oxidoreductase
MKRLNFLNRYSSWLLAVLRIMTALLLLSAGLVKLVGFPAGAQPGQMPIMSLLGIAAILEVAGGILLILGLFTRPVAFVLSGEMAVAYWMVHAPKSFFPILNQGAPAILFCFIFLYLVAAGPGAWSIDSRLESDYRP